MLDWTDEQALRRAAKRVQIQLVKMVKSERPLFELVQSELIPSQKAIMEGLMQGAYQEFLK